MARIITKQLAEKIVKKLGAKKSPTQARGSGHDLYDFEYGGTIIFQFSLRRGSMKDLGHDHLPADLHLGPNKAKQLAQCPLSMTQYLDILREKNLLPEPEDVKTEEPEAEDEESPG